LTFIFDIETTFFREIIYLRNYYTDWDIGACDANKPIGSDSQAIRRFNINSNEYLEHTDRKEDRDVIALR